MGSVSFFAAYQVAKSRINLLSGRNVNESTSDSILLAGGIAGMAYVVSSHPFESTAVLLQLDNPSRPKYSGLVDCFRQVLRRDGIFGLYRGMAPTLARAFPAYAAAFYGYECSLEVYNQYDRLACCRL